MIWGPGAGHELGSHRGGGKGELLPGSRSADYRGGRGSTAQGALPRPTRGCPSPSRALVRPEPELLVRGLSCFCACWERGLECTGRAQRKY